MLGKGGWVKSAVQRSSPIGRAFGLRGPRKGRPWKWARGVLDGKGQPVRVAAIDLGKVRVGLALSDELGLLAHPRQWLDGKSPGRLLRDLCALAESEEIERFLVGLPRNLDGREGANARRARRFAERLGELSGRPVELVDEWLTTVEARQKLRDQGMRDKEARSRIDSAAAAVLLQAWLDGRRAQGELRDEGPDDWEDPD